MEPQILDLPEVRVVGVPYFGNNNEGQIPAMWGRFNTLAGLLTPIQSGCHIYYGVETYTDDMKSSGQWYYLAGAGVDSLDEIPVQLAAKIIPAGRYAVFTHTGPLPGKLGETFAYIYKQWLPQSKFQPAGPYDFERYDERFKGPNNEDSVMEVCVPIKPR